LEHTTAYLLAGIAVLAACYRREFAKHFAIGNGEATQLPEAIVGSNLRHHRGLIYKMRGDSARAESGPSCRVARLAGERQRSELIGGQVFVFGKSVARRAPPCEHQTRCNAVPPRDLRHYRARRKRLLTPVPTVAT
jgi:hypothetical protein